MYEIALARYNLYTVYSRLKVGFLGEKINVKVGIPTYRRNICSEFFLQPPSDLSMFESMTVW